jgi:hypothetical protein
MQCARRQLLRYDCVSCGGGGVGDRWTCLPRRFLAQEEVRIADPKTNLMSRLTDVSITKGLQSRQEEGS